LSDGYQCQFGVSLGRTFVNAGSEVGSLTAGLPEEWSPSATGAGWAQTSSLQAEREKVFRFSVATAFQSSVRSSLLEIQVKYCSEVKRSKGLINSVDSFLLCGCGGAAWCPLAGVSQSAERGKGGSGNLKFSALCWIQRRTLGFQLNLKGEKSAGEKRRVRNMK